VNKHYQTISLLGRWSSDKENSITNYLAVWMGIWTAHNVALIFKYLSQQAIHMHVLLRQKQH